MAVQKADNTKRTVVPKKTTAVKKAPHKKSKVEIKFATKPAESNKPQAAKELSIDCKSIINSITGKDNLTKGVDLNTYPEVLVKDFKTMVKKSHQHLLGLIKLYEGDSENNYEGKVGKTYNDKYGKKTKGFGCTKTLVKMNTQEDAYLQLEKDLKEAAETAKNKINNRLGKGTFEKLKLSIKEALIDLSFNKGPDKVVKPELLNAIKRNDYSAIVANLYYVHSGEKKNGTEEDPGLYRRSLSRMILATRDLTGKEKTEAQAEIDKFYEKAKRCFKKNNKPSTDLDTIYNYYKTGKFEEVKQNNNSNNSIKMTIGDVFKSKGGWSIARAAYQAQDTSKMSFKEYYELFLKINSKDNLDNIRVNGEINIPVIDSKGTDSTKLIENINKIAEKDSVNNKKTEITETETKTENKESGFLTRIGRWFKNKLKSFGRWVKGIFTPDKEASGIAGSEAFQKVIKDGNAKEIGEFTLYTLDYTVKKGETVYGISKEYDTSQDLIKDDNNLEDIAKINENQVLKIQKLGYKIKDKETLSSISQKFGLTLEILKDINGIEDADSVKEGQTLEIPGFSYTVKPGDTLTQIAKKVGVTVKHLRAINGLDTDIIHPGDQIIVIFNNADYAVPDSQKKVTVDKVTKTVTETIDMTSRVKGIKGRPLLATKQRENGKVVPTRKEFSLTPEQKKKAKHPLPLDGKTIIVNAGHGYSEAPNPDVGALSLGRDGVEDEWICNHDNALKLKDKLVAQGAKVIYIQGAVNAAAAEIEKARNKADLFISVHVNAHKGNTQDRTQIYYTSSKHRAGTSVNKKSKQLAQIMEKNFDNWIPKHEKISNGDKFVFQGKQDYAQTKSEGLLVCNTAEAKHNAPSVLWEVAFMGSHKGRLRLKDENLMNNYASIMSQSVVEYFKQQKKS